MIRTVVLHGYLRKRFGRQYKLDVDSPAEVVRALGVQVKGFLSAIRYGEFRVLRGSYALGEAELGLPLDKEREFHIVPVASGSKRGGLLKVILGVALIGIGFAVMGGAAAAGSATMMSLGKTLLTFGAGMFFNGLGQMLSPTPEIDPSHEGPATRQSHVFGGTQNLTEEGNIVPVVYGVTWSGSVVTSAGMNVKIVS
ncbi:hypothetical protein [Pyramidobacter piscolens]|uniref:hypothetical protein n=1 Tax=Pyramidobacter piscolens TaxID=638849 RepID=UPI001FCBB059|nr:hypothetical protein [Pyramidobacter piscolens]BDF77886.1 tail assembly protein [Pyramidobacter piscolens]BDF78671.1 tail assembly protein [Pyramidobacter piscolens]